MQKPFRRFVSFNVCACGVCEPKHAAATIFQAICRLRSYYSLFASLCNNNLWGFFSVRSFFFSSASFVCLCVEYCFVSVIRSFIFLGKHFKVALSLARNSFNFSDLTVFFSSFFLSVLRPVFFLLNIQKFAASFDVWEVIRTHNQKHCTRCCRSDFLSAVMIPLPYAQRK